MKDRLENGINSLIAYYFKMTGFKFIDEYDFKILLDLASICGIQTDFDDNMDPVHEIAQFLSKLGNVVQGRSYKGIVAWAFIDGPIYNSEKRKFDKIYRLKIDKNFTRRVWTHCGFVIKLDSLANSFFDEIIGDDMDILISKMPDSNLLKKYMTLKKVILCKTPCCDFFYENIASDDLYDSFDDWETDCNTRGIYQQTYQFVKDVEEKIIGSTKQQLGKRLVKVLSIKLAQDTKNNN